MASRVPVEAETILDSPSARLTAVAISVRAGHTIAFLGDSRGNLHKVNTLTLEPKPPSLNPLLEFFLLYCKFTTLRL